MAAFDDFLTGFFTAGASSSKSRPGGGVGNLGPFFDFGHGQVTFGTGGESSSMSLSGATGMTLLLVVCEI